ncbi:MAG: hypothetical protein LBG15_03530 [Dysgonamonadaceae bacterium]|jgi:hypothetical protein|nr:hypothetical protein [Dysgonamonadaceae bacterium]
MKKQIKSIAIILCLFIPVVIQAQEIVAGYSLGYGKYLLGDLKTMQEKSVEGVQNIFENYKSTETFPEGLFHDVSFGVKFSIHEIGLKYDYLTSGGRNHLADYSGEIKEDMIASGDALGLYYKIHFLSFPLNNHFRLTAHAGVATGAIYNKLNDKRFFTLYDPKPHYSNFYNDRFINYNTEFDEFDEFDETVKFRSTNWYVQPNIGVQLEFKNTVFLNISAGYLFDNQGKLQTAYESTIENIEILVPYVSSYTYYYQYNTPGKEYNAGIDWTGLRLSVGIGFAFSIAK